jgi:outer membrane receptor for ferrienterochelin and colicin
MVRSVFKLLLVCHLLAVPAAAQEQRGSIEGVVTDSSGAVLPGATVDARSPAMVGVTTVVSDTSGQYRFPSLPPGRYEITANLQGFTPAKASNVLLELGQVLKINLTLSVGDLTENVQVTGETPLIDVKQNSAGADIRSEVIDRIPKGRDFTAIATSAPGIDNESRNNGIQIDGASGADNRFIIDGVDTTNLARGTSGRVLRPDFIQEIQVKASGYNAEYRAAIGGVISAITKSGSNEWHGGFGGYYGSDAMVGNVRPTLQLNPSNQTQAQYVDAPADKFKNEEGVFDLGGPIMKDKVWFYAAYNPQSTDTHRTVRFTSNSTTETFQNKPVDQTVNYNVTTQIRNDLRAKFAASNERVKGGLALPSIQTNGTSTQNPSLFPSPTRNDSYKDSYSGVFDWVPESHTYVNLTLTSFRYGSHDVGTFSSALRHTFSGSNFQFADVPATLKNVNGYADNPASNRQVRDNFGSYNANADITRYLNWKGTHTLKGGIQFERQTNDVLSGAQAPTIALSWGASYSTVDGRDVTGKYGYYQVSRLYTQGDVVADNMGLFLQDAWTLNNRLTLNLGIRAENEDVPSYRPENLSIHFGFADKIAPRAGFAWDVKGDSQWKVYGSYGAFYDLLKLTIGRVMTGADRWISYYYTLDDANWPAINCDGPPGSGCPGNFIALFDNRSVANNPSHNLITPDLHPTQTREFTLGMDHELNKTMSVGTRYVHKWAPWVIESVCQFVETGEDCGINNPGHGTIGLYPFGTNFPPQPKPVRDYDGLEFRLKKRYANHWSLDASYLLSRLWGNWSGVASSDEAVNCLQPNSCLAFNFLYYSYDASARPSNGVLGTDRPNQLKLQGTYDLPWGTMLGVNFLAENGIPKSTIIKERTDGTNFFPYGRGNLGRTPFLNQTDLLVQHQVKLPRNVRATLGLNVINLFDQMTATLFQTTPYRDAFSVSDTDFFAGFDPTAYAAAHPNIRADPRFGQASQYQGQRVATVQFKVNF